MKKTLRKNERYLVTLILTISMMLSMANNVFAGWETYNSGTVYLEETWVGNKQCINFYTGGQWKRNVAGEGNTLWINSIPVLNNLYSTGYWCFDKYGNTWVINTSQQLLLCKADTTSFVVNNSITGCTGFQRDSGKVGYLVYTNNGTYALEDLLNNNYFVYDSNNYYGSSKYTYVEKFGTWYYCYTNGDVYDIYYFGNSELRYMGTNNKSTDVTYASNVKDITFDIEKGYIVYSLNYGTKIYAYAIGEKITSNRKQAGSNFLYFEKTNNTSTGYINTSGNYQVFSYSSNNNSSYYYNNNNNYNYNKYPYVDKNGNNFIVYVSEYKFYAYYFYNSKLYSYGTNSTSTNNRKLISSSVKNITFDIDNGYIVYALSGSTGTLNALPFGETNSKYKVTVGTQYSYFDKYYGDYCSRGYTKTTGYYKMFEYEEEQYPYVEFDEDSNYYYVHINDSKCYIYYLSKSGYLYDKGTNSSSRNTKIASEVEEVKFSTEGYIVFANEDREVSAVQFGKTSSSYKKYQGNRFSYFDTDEDEFWCNGYINTRGTYIEFDFD